MTSYNTEHNDINLDSRSNDKLIRTMEIHEEIIDQLINHGCKKCIAIIQKVIRDNIKIQNLGEETTGLRSEHTGDDFGPLGGP